MSDWELRTWRANRPEDPHYGRKVDVGRLWAALLAFFFIVYYVAIVF